MIVDNLIVGKRCPYCGGAITACDPIRVTSRYRTAPDDEVRLGIDDKAKVVGEGVTEYIHTITGLCKPCGRAFSFSQMQVGEPRPPMLARVGA